MTVFLTIPRLWWRRLLPGEAGATGCRRGADEELLDESGGRAGSTKMPTVDALIRCDLGRPTPGPTSATRPSCVAPDLVAGRGGGVRCPPIGSIMRVVDRDVLHLSRHSRVLPCL